MNPKRSHTSATKKTPARAMNGKSAKPHVAVADVERCLNEIAPPSLAQDWDNVGLLVGDRDAPVSSMLLCIDLTPSVAKEATRRRCDFVVAYHPPLFRPTAKLLAPGAGMEAVVLGCVRAGMAIYAPHTALDAAQGGTNDVLAELCGLSETTPLPPAASSPAKGLKLVTFVPSHHVDRVAEALFEAGAGHIGDYSRCSFRTGGRGTFFGGESTNPVVGQSGRLEYVDELRVEVVVPRAALGTVCDALRRAHPYEEPAFDIYPLEEPPRGGIGRIGHFPKAITLGLLVERLKRETNASDVQIVGKPRERVRRAVIVAGAAGTLPLQAGVGTGDVVVTGEIRHHDALTLARQGCAAIALGHWASERPVLRSLRDRLAAVLPSISVAVSTMDADPFRPA